jgi:hypothetical protein
MYGIMNDQDLVTWLMSNAGPVIRLRTASEVISCGKKEKAKLTEQATANPVVRNWLTYLANGHTWHGAEKAHLENSTLKLADLGIKRGNAQLDSLMSKHILRLKQQWQESQQTMNSDIILCSSCLAFSGHGNEPVVQKVIGDVLRRLVETARRTDFRFYVDQRHRHDIPHLYKGKPIIKPDYCSGGLKLPKIMDLYALKGMVSTGTPSDSEEIDCVLRFVLDTRYQALSPGHGYFESSDGRWFHAGWAANVPGYFGFDFDDWAAGFTPSESYSSDARRNEFRNKGRWGIPHSLVQRVELLSVFPYARKHRWFKHCLEHLEAFRTEKGTYRFPKEYLLEKSSGYWVTGAYMRCETGKPRIGMELDSTFRMMVIKKNADMLRI